MGLLNRPCGACGELVSAVDGCRHWKPNASSGKRPGWVKGRARRPAARFPADSPEAYETMMRVLRRGGVDAQASNGVEYPNHPAE